MKNLSWRNVKDFGTLDQKPAEWCKRDLTGHSRRGLEDSDSESNLQLKRHREAILAIEPEVICVVFWKKNWILFAHALRVHRRIN